MWTLFFTAEPGRPTTTRAKTSDTARFARFFWAMMDRGVYLPCSQFEAAFVSAVHTDEHIDQTIAAAREALRHVRAGSVSDGLRTKTVAYASGSDAPNCSLFLDRRANCF